nr:hypothetical protein [Actinomycetota bacterium]
MASPRIPSENRVARRTLPRMVVVVAALALAVAAAAQPRDSETPSPAALRATGAASIFNSHEGEAIVSASALRPSTSTTGTVSIRNTGSVPAAFTLSRGELGDAPGAGGGRLSDVLVLDVVQMTDAGPVTLYSGALRGMDRVAIAGAFAPGESREFGFAVRFPDGGAPTTATSGDNAYQGATATVRFDWNAVGEGAAPADPAPSSPAPSDDPAASSEPEPVPFIDWPAVD